MSNKLPNYKMEALIGSNITSAIMAAIILAKEIKQANVTRKPVKSNVKLWNESAEAYCYHMIYGGSYRGVQFDFNGKNYFVTHKSTVSEMMKIWNAKQESSRAQYERSAEYKAYQNEQRIQRMKDEAEERDLLAKLETLDFTNIDAVMDWMTPAVRQMECGRCVKGVVEKFVQNGFIIGEGVIPEDATPEEKAAAKLLLDTDKTAMARYIIGQTLNFVEKHNCVAGVAVHFTEKWNEQHNPNFVKPKEEECDEDCDCEEEVETEEESEEVAEVATAETN